jgi:hypothetical protein
MLGDFAEELLLSGQYVVPKAAIDSGFVFAYPTIEAALDTIVGNAPPARPVVTHQHPGSGCFAFDLKVPHPPLDEWFDQHRLVRDA